MVSLLLQIETEAVRCLNALRERGFLNVREWKISRLENERGYSDTRGWKISHLKNERG